MIFFVVVDCSARARGSAQAAGDGLDYDAVNGFRLYGVCMRGGRHAGHEALLQASRIADPSGEARAIHELCPLP